MVGSEKYEALVLLYLLNRLRFLLLEVWVACYVCPPLDVSETALQNGAVVIFYASLGNFEASVL